jgi:predicted dehydrogenase
MSHAQDRRLFLQTVAASAATAALVPTVASRAQDKTSPNERIQIGIMGVNGRGGGLAKSYMGQKGVDIAYICDVDERALNRVTATVEKEQGKAPQPVKDFRRILDDKAIDVLVIAAPNHWHGIATILGCQAGKNVYVEKPCCHTPEEGELAIAAARKNKVLVTMGSQRRSWPAIREGIERVHKGDLGRVIYSRTWYNNRRPSIGIGKPAEVPSWLDWTLWQGPCTEKPFKDNLIHYNWHWHWHWGNGELGNNGIHALDVARWALDVKFPERVTAGGGHYRHEDDQETPDSMMVTYDFPDRKMITWEGLSWSAYGPGGDTFGLSIHGDKGTMVITGNGYVIYNLQNKEEEKKNGPGGDADHLNNFLTCIREGSGKLPNADIEEAHRSTLLCHLGNIAYRTGRVLKTDPQNGHILEDDKAMAMWTKEYREGWKPKA